MSEKKTNSKKSLAIFALPICIALGISVGAIFGLAAGSISKGICFGIIGGAVIGLIIFGILYSKKNDEDK